MNMVRVSFSVFALLLLCLAGMQGHAGPTSEISLQQAQQVFPGIDGLGAFGADPRAAPVTREGKVVGYVFLTDDVVAIPAYSGKPISTLVGLDLQARITGLTIVQHQEPILVVGISDQNLQGFIDQYRGRSVNERFKIGGAPREGYQTLDGISGATISVMVLNASIGRSARKVAAALDLPRSTQPQGAAQPGAKGAVEPSVAKPIAETEPVWIEAWKNQQFQIVILSLGLVFLLSILVTQDWLARHPTLLIYIRTGYLLFTLIFIGWYALAQLSIVNVMTFMNSLMHDFQWESFMIDPLMFILWGFVAMTVLMWGRGVYCGWLCPFGALQELLFRLAKRLRIPSYEPPEVVHERLWALKYIILLGLFGVSLHSLTQMERLSEVEPFKTAITLRFQREWGFLLYAAILLLISLFTRKFFCRYLCPLGAALTFPSRFRIFDWLRRRKECGRPCQICREECEVRSIKPTGEIIANECHYCLDCQVTYWNAHKCPPLVERRKRREKATAMRASVSGVEVALDRTDTGKQ